MVFELMLIRNAIWLWMWFLDCVCVLRSKCWSGLGVCYGSMGGIDLGLFSHLNMYGGFGLVVVVYSQTQT